MTGLDFAIGVGLPIGLAVVGVLAELILQARSQPIIVRPGSFLKAVERSGSAAPIAWECPVRTPQVKPFNKDVERLEETGLDAAAALEAVGVVGTTLASWHSVSDNVLQAVSHMTHEDIHSFADLFTAVHERGYDLASSGFFNELRGHVGEWQAMKDFAPWQPFVPIDSNNPGFDLGFGDHGVVNVKVTQDAASTLAHHFGQYPDVAAVVNADALHIPSDALYFDPRHLLPDASILEHANHVTIVDTALTAAGTGEQTTQAIGILESPVSLNFPWITVVVAVVVEGALVARGKTTFERAAKNTAITTSSVGIFGILGKLGGGAAGGAIFGPPGMLVGALIGGIGGILGGRVISKEIIRGPLREALKQAQTRAHELRLSQLEAAKWADGQWRAITSSEQARLSSDIAQIDGQVQPVFQTIARSDRQRSEILLEAMRDRLDFLSRSLRKRLGVIQLWARINPMARKRATAFSESIDNWEAARRGCEDDFGRLGDLLAAVPSEQSIVAEYAARVISARATFYAETQKASEIFVSRTASVRLKSVHRLKDHWSKIQDSVVSRTATAQTKVLEALDKLALERRAAGLE